MAEPDQFVRVIAVRRALTPTDFGLRRGEEALSLFRIESSSDVKMVVAAVKAAGKMGRLAAAELSGDVLTELGLELVVTPGETPDPRANALHVEARLAAETLAFAKRLGMEPRDFYNQQLAAALSDRARIVFEEGVE